MQRQDSRHGLVPPQTRRRQLDPQYLLDQAHDQNPVPSTFTGGFRLTRPDASTRDIDVVGVEMFRKIADTASAGDNVGLLLRSVSRDEIARGDVLER